MCVFRGKLRCPPALAGDPIMKSVRLLAVASLFSGCLFSLSPVISPASRAADIAKPSKYWVYFGTYSGGSSKGIYRSEFDSTTGKLGPVTLAAEAHHPSFLAIHPNQ